MNKFLNRDTISFIILTVFLVLAAEIVLNILFIITEPDVDTQRTQSQDISFTVSANKLSKEYNDNEVAADRKYDGKIVIVSGEIHSIGKDITDDAYIVIGGSGFLDGVQCFFTVSEQASIFRLSKGQHVKVKGEVRGKTIIEEMLSLMGVKAYGNVLVRNCRLQ